MNNIKSDAKQITNLLKSHPADPKNLPEEAVQKLTDLIRPYLQTRQFAEKYNNEHAEQLCIPEIDTVDPGLVQEIKNVLKEDQGRYHEGFSPFLSQNRMSERDRIDSWIESVSFRSQIGKF